MRLPLKNLPIGQVCILVFRHDGFCAVVDLRRKIVEGEMMLGG